MNTGEGMDQEFNYQNALDYLDSLVDYSLMRNLQFNEEKFNLRRMIALLEQLGNPQEKYPIIHVAGTKGKGSTCAFIESGLRSSGYSVGLYTSPHLLEYTERIQVDRRQITREELAEIVADLRPIAERIGQITKFELTTAAAFVYFSRKKVDFAVIEVGLGGRLDATNVVIPLVSVITSLSYDHMNILGNTLAAIAAEKAGIIKPGIPVVVSPQKPEALSTVLENAQEKNAPVVLLGRDVHYAGYQKSLAGQDIYVWDSAQQDLMDQFIENADSGWRPDNLHIELLGQHQVQNAATAFAVLQVIEKQGYALEHDKMLQGFANTRWPGRFEIVHEYPWVVFDSAHNRDSAQRMRITLQDYFPDKPVVLLFGVSEDKDVAGMFEELLPGVERVVAAQAVTSRAMEAGKIVQLAHQFGKPATTGEDVRGSLLKAYHFCEQNKVLLITGSMFLVAEARQAWDALVKEGQV